jgi:MYXO-CTERM domain-containing protein
MRRLFLLGLLLCLVLAAPASAKEVLSAKVCGENGCVTSRDRGLIAALAEGGDPVDPPKAAAPFFRVRLTIGDEKGKVVDRFWTHFVPKGELIRGSDGTWMRATDAYTGALKKVVNPSMAAYPASRLAKLVPGDQPAPAYQAHVSSVMKPPGSQPETDGGGIAVTTIGLVGAGALAVAVLLVFAVRRRRRMITRAGAA